jgi:hypothetical protein
VVVPGTPVMTDIGIYNLSVKENKKQDRRGVAGEVR